MSNRMSLGMAEATRLTSTGNLAEATALIQRLLQGGDIPEPAHTGPASTAASPTIIDVEPVVIDDAEPQPKAKAAKPEPKPASGFTGKFHPKPRTGLAETLRDLAARAKTAQFDAGQFDIGKFDIGKFDISGLSGLSGFSGAGLRPTAEPLPDGASFTTATFSNQAGSRDYKLYVPAKRTGQPMPLVVMLHGCTQSPEDFAAGTRMNALAEEHGCIVVYPQQPSSANAQKCWNWFTPNDQGRDRGEPSIIAGITRQVIADHPVDAARVYVAGLSAGGAAAAIMGAAYPELYAAVCVHSGLPVGAARDIPSAFAAMRQGGGGTGAASSRPVPTIVFHGDKDSTVNLRNGDAVVAQAKASASGLKSTIENGQATAPGGHGYSRTVHADASGKALCEQWTIQGAGHAWAGGSPSGSYTDPRGPDASREMLRFFFEHSL
ncbi:poly(hydroxyalkanoate) depolymerase family esterase [Skermanella aerolata]|uniref:extracellular catalytic domain type 1 short-chain-length polyhydroxyalkanoate depolymerase n=1 Tax=Skermanella aerolata TaxID=393310 RepID=UPI003D22C0E8